MKFFTVFLMATLLMVAGCGKSGPELYEVEGTVTYHGKNLPLGSVMFIPDDPKIEAAVAAIDQNGHYKIKAAPGSYSVQIQMVARLRGQEAIGEGTKLNMPEVDWLIPAKYGNFQSSGLKAVVKKGENPTLDFPLK